jgi:hypothetical protein
VSDFALILILALAANSRTEVVTLTALKGKYGMLIGGFLLGILWIVGSIRLDPARQAGLRVGTHLLRPRRARRVPAQVPPRAGPPVALPGPPAAVPTQITRGVLLAVAAGLAGLVAVLNLAMVLADPLLPFAALGATTTSFTTTCYLSVAHRRTNALL